jgi:CarD family transcriptional regulator
MTFDVGDKVVYPHHGAATIEKREKKEAFGEKRDYLVLRLAYGDLTLMVPADNAEEIGLRDVINDEEVEEVFAVLRKKEARMPTNWSRRFKNHVEKLKSGDIYQVAEVVRNLSIREEGHVPQAVRRHAWQGVLRYSCPSSRSRLQARRGDRRGEARRLRQGRACGGDR